MDNPRTRISEADQHKISNDRVSLQPSIRDVRYNHVEIDFPVSLIELLHPDPALFIAPLYFMNCIFNDTVDLGGYLSAGDVFFENCEFMENVALKSNENVRIKRGNIFRRDLLIGNAVDGEKIGNFSVDGRLIITADAEFISVDNVNTDLGQQEFIVRGNIREFEISRSYFNKIHAAVDNKTKTDFFVNACLANKFVAEEMFHESSLDFQESQINEIKLSDTGKNKISFKMEYCRGIKNIILPLSTLGNVQISQSEIGTLELQNKFEKPSNLTVETTTLENLLFWHINNEGLLAFRGIQISKGGILSFLSSNLGKTELIGCDFSRSVLQFDNSRLIDIFLSESDFPRKIFTDNKQNHIQAQLAFGQLSTVFQKQGDTVRALEYQSREIEAHYHTIPLFRRSIFFLNLTKITLWLNKWSNDFGRNWGFAVIFTFGAGAFFFYLLILSSSEYRFAFPITFDSRLISSYLRFINPLRFFDTEGLFRFNDQKSFIKLSVSSYFWDFLGRIFTAYGFYQAIQAFRRYGRK